MRIYITKVYTLKQITFVVYNESMQQILSGKAENIFSYRFGKISLLNKSMETVCTLRQIGFVRKLLSVIPIISMFIYCPYHYIKNGTFYGKFKQKYACQEIVVRGQTYSVKLHTGCIISIWKNSVQVGKINLIKPLISENQRYCVQFNSSLDMEFAVLLTIFASVIFLEDYDMYEIKYTNVPFNTHANNNWLPDEENASDNKLSN